MSESAAPADADQPDAEGRLRVALTGDVDIYAAEALKAQLLDQLQRALVLELDLAEVSLIDTAGMQILVLLKRIAERDGRVLKLSQHSATAAEAIHFLGLAPFFGDPLPIQPQWT
jgi:anti-sigma B factor antagonist